MVYVDKDKYLTPVIGLRQSHSIEDIRPIVMPSRILTEALLMSTHNICFRGEIRKISTFFG